MRRSSGVDEKHRHKWSKWDNTAYVHGGWVRVCTVCWKKERKQSLNFLEWLLNEVLP
jgi:hypothetical protein